MHSDGRIRVTLMGLFVGTQQLELENHRRGSHTHEAFTKRHSSQPCPTKHCLMVDLIAKALHNVCVSLVHCSTPFVLYHSQPSIHIKITSVNIRPNTPDRHSCCLDTLNTHSRTHIPVKKKQKKTLFIL